MFEKVSIDTLPVWEAQKETDGCIFCLLRNQLEEQYLDHYMGDAKMESDVRIEVNGKGFCPRHYHLMLTSKEGKLGLGLMTHTHLMEKTARLKELLQRSGDTEGKKAEKGMGFAKIAQEMLKDVHTCAVCDKIETHMAVYYKTFMYLMEHDEAFKESVQAGKGFCFEHFSALCASASKGLVQMPKRKASLKLLTELELNRLDKDIADIEWFTRKFDYRNADKPWGDSKDALPRCMERLEGRRNFGWGK